MLPPLYSREQFPGFNGSYPCECGSGRKARQRGCFLLQGSERDLSVAAEPRPTPDFQRGVTGRNLLRGSSPVPSPGASRRCPSPRRHRQRAGEPSGCGGEGEARPRPPLPGPWGAALQPPAKGSAPWGLAGQGACWHGSSVAFLLRSLHPSLRPGWADRRTDGSARRQETAKKARGCFKPATP